MRPGDLVSLLYGITTRIRLYSEPQRNWESLSTNHGSIGSGEVCIVLNAECGFLKVMSPAGAQGWISTSRMRLV